MDYTYGGAEKKAVILELGSSFIKCGFAGEGAPRHIISSELASNFERKPPLSCDEWSPILGRLFSRIYFRHLQAKPKERRVVICEHLLTPKAFRESIAFVLFKKMKVPSLYYAPGEFLALYTTGLHTGIIVDIGRSETRILPVYEGLIMHSAYTTLQLGSEAILDRLQQLLEASSPALSQSLLQDILVRVCFVLPAGGAEEVQAVEFPTEGARSMQVTGAARSQAAEILFMEDADGEGNSLPTSVLNALQLCPIDVRAAIVQNVLVTGGTAMLPGLCHRLREDILRLAQDSRFASLKAVLTAKLAFAQPTFPRHILAWQGGSLVAATEALQYISISGEDCVANQLEALAIKASSKTTSEAAAAVAARAAAASAQASELERGGLGSGLVGAQASAVAGGEDAQGAEAEAEAEAKAEAERMGLAVPDWTQTESFPISIKMAGGHSFTLRARSSDSVDELKASVHRCCVQYLQKQAKQMSGGATAAAATASGESTGPASPPEVQPPQKQRLLYNGRQVDAFDGKGFRHQLSDFNIYGPQATLYLEVA